MSITVPIVSASGAKSTVTLPDPVVVVKIATALTDDFGAGINAAVWASVGTVAAASGGVQVSHAASGNSMSYVETVGTYDLTNSAVYVQMADFGALAANDRIEFQVGANIGAGALEEFAITPGTLLCGGNDTTWAWHNAGSVTLNTTTHRWLRIRHAGSTIYWDAGPDGSTWVQLFSRAAQTWNYAAVKVRLVFRLQATPGTAGSVRFDNVNTGGTATPPPPPVPTITGVTPNPGTAGPVTVAGTNFIAGATVNFDGAAATNVVVTSATQLTCTAPSHTAGAATVTVTTTSGTSNGYSFTYQAPPPPQALPPLWNAQPPTGTCPDPSGVPSGGTWDVAPLATNELWDHFDGAAGTKPDSRLWVLDTINQGGTQAYTPDNCSLDGQGNAVLEARLTTHVSVAGDTWATLAGGLGGIPASFVQGWNPTLGATFPVGTPINIMTSGRFTARNKWNTQYGWHAARIKMPKTSGATGKSWFPAWWLLFANWYGFTNNNAPYLEIDMMEFFGNSMKYSSHLWFRGGLPDYESDKPVPGGANAGDGFHTYWILWEVDRIRIGVDDLVVGDWSPAGIPGSTPVTQQAWQNTAQPAYIITNFAIAPGYLPAPIPSDFPAQMVVDWMWYKPLAS